jgi:hypothetical protein
MAARLVPWTIVGASLLVLGTLVLATPFLDASPAALSGEATQARPVAQSLAIGLTLVCVGLFLGLTALLRSETPR